MRKTFQLLVFSTALYVSLPSISEDSLVPKGQCSKIAAKATFHVPSIYVACTKNEDCTLSREGCRSCICPIAGNVRYMQEIESIDREIKLKNNALKVCEACSMADILHGA